jgi:hypothetical protein
MKIVKMKDRSIKIIIVKKILKGEYKLKDKIINKVRMKKKLEIKKIKILIVLYHHLMINHIKSFNN